MIEYKIKAASRQDLWLHLNRCDNQFVPQLSKTVNLKEYASKLHKKAVTIEAWNENELVGIIAIYLNRKKLNIGYISNVSILKDFERNGIASKLLKMAKEYASENDFFQLSLEVNSKNDKAILFYIKNKFIIESEDDEILKMNYSINRN